MAIVNYFFSVKSCCRLCACISVMGAIDMPKTFMQIILLNLLSICGRKDGMVVANLFHVGPLLMASKSPLYESWIDEDIKFFIKALLDSSRQNSLYQELRAQKEISGYFF